MLSERHITRQKDEEGKNSNFFEVDAWFELICRVAREPILLEMICGDAGLL